MHSNAHNVGNSPNMSKYLLGNLVRLRIEARGMVYLLRFAISLVLQNSLLMTLRAYDITNVVNAADAQQEILKVKRQFANRKMISNKFVGRDEAIETGKESLLSLYRTLVTERLPKILEAVNISKIIESRINEMDVKESEKLILEVMNRELKAIVWLGALLGFVMGCVNLLF